MTSKLFFRTFFSAASAVLISYSALAYAELDQAKPLEFTEAYRNVIDNALRLKAAEAEIGVKEAERLQAGLYPNPDLSIAAEELGGSGRWDDNEISVGITQLFLTGGKRSARIRVADAAQCETRWELEIMKCDLYAELMHAFINSATAQERLQIAEDLLKIAEQTYETVSSKAAHGKATSIDAKKSEVAFKTARLFKAKTQVAIQQAKLELAALWNSNNPQFGQVIYSLYDVTPPPPFDQLTQELDNNPDLSKSHAVLSKTWEIIELERRQRIPDVAVYVGVSTERFTQDPTLNVGIDIPLPIFDRNQGNIARATHQYNQALLKQMDLITQLKYKLAALYREWTNAYEQAAELKDIVATTASETYELAKESYDLGNSEYLEFLDARATMFNVRQQYLDAVEAYHHKKAEILRLTAKCCPSIFNES